MKNGLIYENGELHYYKNDRLYHAGVVKVEEDYYYIGSKGRAVKGSHVVHGEMTNGLLKRGTYRFGDDYKLIPGSYIAPKKKKKSVFKKWKKWVPGLCVTLVLALGVLACFYSDALGNLGEKGHIETQLVEPVVEEQTSHLPDFTEPVLLCSDAAKQMYDGVITVEQAVDQAGVAYSPLEFTYDFADTDASLVIMEKDGLANTRHFELPAKYTSILIHNLKTDTEYVYKVTVGEEVYEGTFRTEASPRFISIPGVSNTRDIGGYQNMDGKTVKQGMIIRGSEMDGLGVASYFLDATSIEDVRSTFGFVYDFDLRGGSIYTGAYQSRLGEDVQHKFYGSPQYGEIFSKGYQPALREIFTDLADPDKYPMYLHCTHGSDRTGTVVFLLQGVLNMSEEDMIREYRMTGFETRSYRNSTSMDIVINGLQAYEGDTLQEKIVSYLVQTIGITHEQIDSIRSILLEE